MMQEKHRRTYPVVIPWTRLTSCVHETISPTSSETPRVTRLNWKHFSSKVESEPGRSVTAFVDSSKAVADLEREFLQLALIWKATVGPTSSPTIMASHPAYQRIIGLGPSVIPFILRDLEDHCDHWFLALIAITGVDPVPNGRNVGSEDMRDWWLNWGRRYGFIQEVAAERCNRVASNPRVNRRPIACFAS
jgi:hypothetical protein